jgi:hypothetical protein
MASNIVQSVSSWQTLRIQSIIKHTYQSRRPVALVVAAVVNLSKKLIKIYNTAGIEADSPFLH